jgi:RHH-type proline utilization regulon transcriptional repressor/proline dehydrogenase/delta 1-pyrroline-5-carboxylate dehydrogenase
MTPSDAATVEEATVEEAVALAAALLATSQANSSKAETRQLARLGRLINDPDGRELVQALTDEVLRIDGHARAARRFSDLVRELGVPSSLGRFDAFSLWVGARLAPLMPRLVMPLAIRRIRSETQGVVLPAEDEPFAAHAKARAAAGVRLNVNVLGEAILSDQEAATRLAAVRERLRRSDVDYVSVKISALCANLDPLAFDDSVDRACAALRILYRDALNVSPSVSRHLSLNVSPCMSRDLSPAKFVNLDMEEFKDLDLTVAAFTRVLSEPEFDRLEAGIVLQAYLPDSHGSLEAVGEWARLRYQRTGVGIKIRLVKGANLAMEQVDAEQHGWSQAPYPSKADVDASYKRMLDSALRPSWAGAVRIGLASHNLFDVAWALVLRDRLEDPNRIEFEMLEGMAPAQARAVNAAAGGLLLYAPVVARNDVDSSIAYLSRRFDENTSPENFLRALFTLTPGSAEFADQADRFRAAVKQRHTISMTSRRANPPVRREQGFDNEPDSDFSLATVRAQTETDPPTIEVRLVDTTDAVDAIVTTARAAAARWAETPPLDRRAVLEHAASVIAQQRFRTLAAMAAEAGKTLREGDPEVSEAIDFARYYGTVGVEEVVAVVAAGANVSPVGVVLVVAPWNFPYAIPAGGVCAALAAGNAVILKPAPETRTIARLLAEQLWEAGVPGDVLQYIACQDDEVGQHLVTHPGIDTVVLTGSYDTARMFIGWRPDMRLLAETSGKNSIVVTAAADIDAALKDVVRSAFGHAGQKCSAASLAIVEASVYDSPTFLGRLADAVTSLTVGYPQEPATIMGPLINPPSGNLRRALTTLEPGERWLVEPRPIDESGRLWSPGVRLGVRDQSWFHLTECFGPVLGVMRADSLDHAIQLQNATAYGLTGGIHSLDPREIRQWLEQVEVGNAYVNRHITGAVVQRQPFGGWKRSSIGCGAKAGGPGYVLSLCNVARPVATSTVSKLSMVSMIAELDAAWYERFANASDVTGLLSERNLLRYRPLSGVLVRVGGDADTASAVGDVDWLLAAAQRCGVRTVVSAGESDEEVLARLDADPALERVRSLQPVSAVLRLALLDRGVALDTSPAIASARVELARWLKEQAISECTHRYGRLVPSVFDGRAVERRRAS